MSGWASLFEGRLQLAGAEVLGALGTLNAIRDVTPARYLVLRSTAAQYVGFIYDTRSDYVHSVAAYDSALAESRTTGEPQITLRVGSWLSRTATVLRGREAGWRALYSALTATPRYSTNDRAVYSVLDNAALATANDAPRLSLRYCNELIQIAHRLSDPATISVALRRRAEQLAKMGENDRGARRHRLPRWRLRSRYAIRDGQSTSDRRRHARERAHRRCARRPARRSPPFERVVDVYRAAHYERDSAPHISTWRNRESRRGSWNPRAPRSTPRQT